MSDTENVPDPTGPERPTSPAPSATDEDGAFAERLPGETIGRYQLRSLLGAGGMGQVFTALDLELGRIVALKLMRPKPVDSSLRVRARLLREAQALAKLHHPNVVSIFDVGRDGDEVFIAMELIDGPTLGAWLGSSPRPWRAVRDAFLAAGRGLAAAHAVGIVHRDFKPSNVIVGVDRVVVVDFGLARSGRDEDDPDHGAGAAITNATFTIQARPDRPFPLDLARAVVERKELSGG